MPRPFLPLHPPCARERRSARARWLIRRWFPSTGSEAINLARGAALTCTRQASARVASATRTARSGGWHGGPAESPFTGRPNSSRTCWFCVGPTPREPGANGEKKGPERAPSPLLKARAAASRRRRLVGTPTHLIDGRRQSLEHR